jgi:hypothetical protein
MTQAGPRVTGWVQDDARRTWTAGAQHALAEKSAIPFDSLKGAPSQGSGDGPAPRCGAEPGDEGTQGTQEFTPGGADCAAMRLWLVRSGPAPGQPPICRNLARTRRPPSATQPRWRCAAIWAVTRRCGAISSELASKTRVLLHLLTGQDLGSRVSSPPAASSRSLAAYGPAKATLHIVYSHHELGLRVRERQSPTVATILPWA